MQSVFVWFVEHDLVRDVVHPVQRTLWLFISYFSFTLASICCGGGLFLPAGGVEVMLMLIIGPAVGVIEWDGWSHSDSSCADADET